MKFAVAVPIFVSGTMVGTMEWYSPRGRRAAGQAQLEALRRVGRLLSAKAAAAELRALRHVMAESSPINTIFANPDLIIQYLNPAASTRAARSSGGLGAEGG